MQYVEDNKGNVVSQKPLIKAAGDTIFSFLLTWSSSKSGKIIEEEVRNSRARGNYMLDRAFVVMMDPNNGDILSMAGKR